MLLLILKHILAFVCPVLIFHMLSEKTSSKIRNSKYWFFGFLSYLILVILTADVWFSLSEYYGYTVVID